MKSVESALSVQHAAAPVAELAAEWKERRISLNYRLGPRHLFSAGFRAIYRKERLSSAVCSEPLRAVPLADSWRRSDLAVIYSLRIDRQLPTVRCKSGMFTYVPLQYQRFFVDMSTASFESYLEGFSSKSRSTLRRKVRKFQEYSGGEIKWRSYSTADEMDEFFRIGREISQRTYQERLLHAGLPSDREFYEEARRLAINDLVRAYILFHDGRPIAYLYMPAEDDVLYYDYLGYDPAYKQWSPGTVLQYLVLSRLFEERRFRYLDFTEGEGQHKELFSTGSVRCCDIYIFKSGARNAALLSIHLMLRFVSRILSSAAGRMNLRSRLRRWMAQ